MPVEVAIEPAADTHLRVARERTAHAWQIGGAGPTLSTLTPAPFAFLAAACPAGPAIPVVCAPTHRACTGMLAAQHL